MKKLHLLILSLLILITKTSYAQDTYAAHKVTLTPTQEIKTAPNLWAAAFVSENKILATGFKDGLVYVMTFNNDQVTIQKTIDLKLPLDTNNQAGMLDIKTHPYFNENHYIYISYSKKLSANSALALIRAKFDPLKNSLNEVTEIYLSSAEKGSKHFGGAITFDNAGYLYLSLGERGVAENAQNTKNDLGTIVKIDDTKQTTTLFTSGHRNPQGLFFDKKRGLLWSVEHGPQGGDELNLIKEGSNYGWPLVTLGEQYGGGRIGVKTLPGYEDPVYSWTPSIAVSSMLVYQGNIFPSLKDKILVVSLKDGKLMALTISNLNKVTSSQLLIDNSIGRIRNIITNVEGNIYLLRDGGGIYKLTYTKK